MHRGGERDEGKGREGGGAQNVKQSTKYMGPFTLQPWSGLASIRTSTSLPLQMGHLSAVLPD